ncbi:MAG: asparagine synthase (glutamine-hydrolyzing) [Phycisphaeraceae bacterium]
MCGIGGILNLDDQPTAPDRLNAMAELLKPRGPDATAFHQSDDHRLNLLHTRLAVIDPIGGSQPMSRDELVVVFNGEIYNHRVIRRRLENLGHTFRSNHADTEVLLHGYREWGTRLLKQLEGMFAFAIYDRRDRSLLLARDRIGKKPLYLHRTGNRFTFASTVAAVAAGLSEVPALSRSALAHYLSLGYTDEQSLLQGITEVPAAHWMRIDAEGQVQRERYWQAPRISLSDTTHDVLPALRGRLTEAVASRLEADVPLGCFLSGGIDSSLVAALAQQQLREKGLRLKTFSAAMPDARYDESAHARRVADHLGTEHHELPIQCDPATVERDLRHLIAITGEPLGDSSILPTYWISQAAREHVTVALSGDGGDELFAGYERYRAMQWLARYRPLLRRLPTWPFPAADGKRLTSRIRRFLEAARPAEAKLQYRSIVRIFSAARLQKLGLGAIAESLAPLNWPEVKDPAEAARRWDVHHYLPFDLLRKVDRASMAVALEVRCPMLDTGVCDLAAHLPLSVLMPNGKLKHLLRRLAREMLPIEIIRRRKMGFAVPIGQWFAGPLKAALQANLLDAPELLDLGADRASLEAMIDQHAAGRHDHTHRLFTLWSLALWLQWKNDRALAESSTTDPTRL